MIGGPCVDMFGSKMIMAISMFFSGVTQLVSPWLAEYGANFLLLCQILFGAVQVSIVPTVRILYAFCSLSGQVRRDRGL